MPDSTQHLLKAQSCLECSRVLMSNGDQHLDWAATQIFYAALHVVEATIFLDQSVKEKHFTSHENRNHFLRTTNRYQKVYKHYKVLFTDSLVARYMSDGHCDFLSYLPRSNLLDQSIGHHLHQIGSSCDRLVGQKLFNGQWQPKQLFAALPS